MSLNAAPTVDPSIGTHIGLETHTMIIFGALAIFALCVDIWAHRKDEPIALKTAVAWTLFWIAISMCFAGYLNYHFNGQVASLFLAGYLFEMALSVDNLFVMMAIFAWFQIPEKYCHRVLYWGVLGAIFFRLLFVIIGSSLFALGPWVEMVFALMVAASGLMMLRKKEEASDAQVDYTGHFAYRMVRMFFPVFPRLVGHSFFVKNEQIQEELKKPENKGLVLKRTGALFATPLFLCLAIIETTDIMFAFDSVPAVIAVSREPLIVYSAMMFAVMGLRSMYFVLDAMRKYLIHLEKAVTVLLFFIAFKLGASASLHLFGFGIDIDVYTSLAVIAVILGLGIVASFIFPEKKEEKIEAAATASAAANATTSDATAAAYTTADATNEADTSSANAKKDATVSSTSNTNESSASDDAAEASVEAKRPTDAFTADNSIESDRAHEQDIAVKTKSSAEKALNSSEKA